MKIDRSIDVEEEIKVALNAYIKTYVRPLPAKFEVPSILVTAVGGSTENTVDYFDVTLDSRASEDATALENLRNAVGIVVKIALSQQTRLRFASTPAPHPASSRQQTKTKALPIWYCPSV